MSDPAKLKVVRLPGVINQVGLSRSTIYLLIQNNAFPKSVRLSERAVGWRQGDIEDWLASRSATCGKAAI